ncbi:MAG: ATP-binding cassette domain-containing protein, partial [Lactobacillus sp.]|nr:ATP-binding cassette domain-containing protein [Lactobacillus sp.]
VDFSYPNRNLFTDLSFSIAVGERIALIGPNGIGKSTLLNLIRNKIQPNHGRIIHHDEINYIPQIDYTDTINDPKSAGEKRLTLIENTIWLPGSLLLLDEPTVYLDENNIENLLYLLKNYNGALLVASHDLDFINRLCQKTIILQPNKVIYFPGNYSQYLEQHQINNQSVINFNDKIVALQQKSNNYNHFKSQKDSTGRFTSRSHDHVQKGLNSRVKRAERELRNLPGKRHVYQHHIQLPEFKNWYKKSTTFSIKIDELLSPRHETILNNTALTLCTGQSLGLIGPNGSGKTTLLKYLKNYFNHQHLLPQATYIGLNLNKQQNYETVADFFTETILGKTDIKRLLVKMDMFVDLSTKIKNLSGGEFAKLALLKQLYLDHETILLIDEPTNYLDPESVIALAKMLKDSHFTCIIASHNRKFLTEFCQSNYLIKEQKLLTID